MPRRRALPACLHNFLGAYTSRYSEFDGYWLFGFVVDKFDLLEFDLLAQVRPAGSAEMIAAFDLARKSFHQQLDRARFDPSIVRQAKLTITRSLASVEQCVNGSLRAGRHLKFEIQVVRDDGKSHSRATKVFVAPHNPTLEFQSGRTIRS
jgi:hypothetical protein